jgi:PAS domain S-box-containing protein
LSGLQEEESESMQTRKLTIWYIVFFCVLVIAYTCLMGYLDIRDFGITITAQTENHLNAIAQTHAENIEQLIRDIKGELEILAQDPRVLESIVDKEFHDQHSHTSEYCPYEALYNHLASCVENLLRVDAKGKVQGVVPFEKELIGTDHSDSPGIECVMKHHNPCVSRVFVSHSGNKSISVAYPVFEREQFVGVVQALVILDKLHEKVNRVRVGEKGYIWIVDGEGAVISHPDKGRIASSALNDGNNKQVQQDYEQVVSKMLNGCSGSSSLKFDSYLKDKALLAWAPINISSGVCRPWSIAVCIGYKEISGPIKAHTRNILIVIICLVSAFSLAGSLYYKAETKKSQFESYKAIDRVNRELQFMSAERDSTTTELTGQLERVRSVIDAIPYSIFWKDKNSVYQGCNKEYARNLGVGKPADIVGKTDNDLTWNEKRAEFAVKCDKEVMKTGVPLLDVEERQYTSDGRIIHLLSNRIPLRDSRGRTNGILGIHVDISKMQSLHAKFSSGSSALNETVSVMQEGVVTTDAHGKVIEANPYFLEITGRESSEVINKPLFASVPGSAGKQIRDGIKNFKEDRGSKQVVFEQKIDNRTFEFRVQPVYREDGYGGAVLNIIDIGSLVEARQQVERAEAEKKKFLSEAGHEIRTPMSNIIGFSELLKQEELTEQQAEFVDKIHISATDLFGLIDNLADKSTKKFGEPLLESKESKGEISDMSKNFEKDKFDDDVTPLGSEDVGSESGAIPESDENAEQDSATSRSAGAVGDFSEIYTEPHILIVDDILENRMLIEVLLKKVGYRTTLCSNGQEAVELAKEHKFDLIIMDVQMPVMDGLEATRIIKSQDLNCNTAVLAITASVEGDANAVCADAGCDDCLPKPIQKNHLLKKVWRFIQQNKQLQAVSRGGDIVSYLEDDPDYEKTIKMFIKNLPGRIKEMQEAFEKGDLEELGKRVHALKGLGGFAGFSVYTEKAKEMEHEIRNEQLENIQKQLEEMTQLCLRTKLARK